MVVLRAKGTGALVRFDGETWDAPGRALVKALRAAEAAVREESRHRYLPWPRLDIAVLVARKLGWEVVSFPRLGRARPGTIY